MCALIVGNKCAFYIVLLRERAKEIRANFVQLAIIKVVGLAQRNLCRRVNRVRVGGIGIGGSVVGVQRYRTAEGAFYTMVIVERTAQICRKAFDERNLPT